MCLFIAYAYLIMSGRFAAITKVCAENHIQYDYDIDIIIIIMMIVVVVAAV